MPTTIDELLEQPWKKLFVHVLLKDRALDTLVNDLSLVFSQEHDTFLRDNWASITEFTLLDPFRMGVILDTLEQIRDLPGDIVECGCYRGGTGLLVGLFLKQQGIKKKIHLFDSFEGLPEVNKKNDKGYRQGEFKSSFEELTSNVKRLGLEDTIVLHKGWFKDTIGSYAENGPKICLLHIDCDLYDSTLDAMALEPLVVVGGAVLFDDYNDGGGGEKRAVKETLPGRQDFHVGPAPQSYYFKGQDISERKVYTTNGSISYSFDRLLANQSYVATLKGLTEIDYPANVNAFLADTKTNTNSAIV